ncbi:MAG: hypothetical protein WAU32_11990 [Thermoanaerobaculia bacterium]
MLRADSTLRDVAVAVAAALEKAGIRAVLTGGGIATIHTRGDYKSEDLDFILQSAPTRAQLDAALRTVGFQRAGDYYKNPTTRFFVEFPRGPLSIGRDLAIRPVEVKIGHGRVLALSPTDSCRDRLAAFYFWNDRQSLDVAIWIALRERVDLGAIRRWSKSEGMGERFGEFERELKRRRRAGGPGGGLRR